MMSPTHDQGPAGSSAKAAMAAPARLGDLAHRVIARAATAPSAHNTQPWLPRVVDEAGVIELGVERGRTLPAGDPTGRDTLLALGCWVEAASVAAAAEGAHLEVELLPGLDDPAIVVRAERDEPVARIRLTTGAAPGAPGTTGTAGTQDAQGTDASAAASSPQPDSPIPDPQQPEPAALDPALLDRRLTYRGNVTAAPGFLAEAQRAVPSWIRLARISAGDLTHFSSLGTADTVRLPAIARELNDWLRLTPAHPRWNVDGLSADVMGIPAPAARALAPFSRRRRLRDGAVSFLRVAGDLWRRLLLEVHLDAPGDAANAEHLVLVVEANELDLGSGVELTRVLNSPIGLPHRVVFEAGRALMRVWLLAAEHGVAFAPQSSVLDSDLAAGQLEYRLGFGRREVPLFVASAGVPDASAPARSRRKPVGATAAPRSSPTWSSPILS